MVLAVLIVRGQGMGVAHITFSVGGATVGYTVVDASVGGQYAHTSFTPH